MGKSASLDLHTEVNVPKNGKGDDGVEMQGCKESLVDFGTDWFMSA